MIFMRPDAKAIDRVIYYSYLNRDLNLTILQLRRTKLMLDNLRIFNINPRDLNDIELSLLSRRDELQNSARLIMEPLFEGIDFGHSELNFWTFSTKDIERNYCRFEEVLRRKGVTNTQIYGRSFIMLLEDYTDPTLGKFYCGELINLSTAAHFLNNIPKRKHRPKNLYDSMTDLLISAMNKKRRSVFLSNENE